MTQIKLPPIKSGRFNRIRVPLITTPIPHTIDNKNNLKKYFPDKNLATAFQVNNQKDLNIALEKEIRPPRPLTHDLFKTFADTFLINVKQIIIHKLVDGVFFSSLICEKDGVEEVIDTRTSDAIALAVRFDAPIFTYENILDKAGIYLKIDEE